MTTPQHIIAAVCEQTGVTEDDLLGRWKNEPRPRARRLCVLLMRRHIKTDWGRGTTELRPMSYPQIAVAMGRSKHNRHPLCQYNQAVWEYDEGGEFTESVHAVEAALGLEGIGV